MAASTSLKGTNYTKVAGVVAGTLSAGSFVNAMQMWGARIRGMYDEFTSGTAWDAGSVISMGLLPKGARVLGFLVSWEAQGAAVTMDLTIGGVAASTAEAVTDMSSAGSLFIPALETFTGTPLTADSIVALVTAAQSTGVDDSVSLTTLYLYED